MTLFAKYFVNACEGRCDMRLQILIAVALLLCATLVIANGSHEQEIAEGNRLVTSKANCDTLSNEQLEAIGEYLMEQMHPGESHVLMDKMMGGEGSESLRQMHIQIARVLYCGESGGMMSGNMMGSGGMMGMMPMMMNGGIMGGQNVQGGMMGPWAGGWGLGVGNVLGTILLIGLIILVWLWVVKLWRDLFGKKRCRT